MKVREHRPLSRIGVKDRLFQDLLESVNESAAAFDSENCLIYANPAFYALTGYALGDVLGKSCLSLFTKKDREKIESETKKRPLGVSSKYEVTLVTKSKRQIPVLVSGSPLAGGGSIGVITDLTEIKAHEKELQEMFAHERRLSTILEHSVDAIITVDMNRRVILWNKGAEKLFGYTEKEILGEIIDVIVPKEHLEQDEIGKMRKETLKKGFLKNFETVRQAKNGNLIPVSISQGLERNASGKIAGYTAIYRDFSENKKWEMELQKRFDTMQRAYMEMGRQRRYLDFFEELMDMAFSKKKPAEIFNYIVNAFAMISQVDAVTLRKYRKEKNNVELVAMTGVSSDWIGKKYIPIKGTLFEKTIQMKSPLRILDLWSEPHYHSPVLARKYDFRALLMYPLFAGDEYMGNIALYLHSDSPVSLLDNEFIGVFAKETAIVLKYLDSAV